MKYLFYHFYVYEKRNRIIIKTRDLTGKKLDDRRFLIYKVSNYELGITFFHFNIRRIP